MNVDGSDRHLLATGATSYWAVAPAWSPRGDTIAFGDPAGLYTVSTSGGRVTSLAPEFFARWKTSSAALPKPSWSPDGTQLAFVTPDGSVNVVGSDGSGPRSLTGGRRVARNLTAVSWSPDGTTIAYADTQGGISTIRVDDGARAAARTRCSPTRSTPSPRLRDGCSQLSRRRQRTCSAPLRASPSSSPA